MARRVALIEVEDVARLFQGLVTALAERDPGRLRAGFEVAELYQQIVPYRTHRNLLGFTTHQDYEGAILGLLAGVGGYASVEPDEVRQTLAAEVDSPNPDPTLFREFAGARVRLAAARVREVLSDEDAYAPPAEAPPPAARASGPSRAPAFELAEELPGAPAPAAGAAPRSAGRSLSCGACGAALPDDRPVVFCPYCGTAVGAPTCARCGDHLRPDWKFCPRCGSPRSA
jgi:RNA polymerase subunit RPABC4/transcription elongation factor Spt4